MCTQVRLCITVGAPLPLWIQKRVIGQDSLHWSLSKSINYMKALKYIVCGHFTENGRMFYTSHPFKLEGYCRAVSGLRGDGLGVWVGVGVGPNIADATLWNHWTELLRSSMELSRPVVVQRHNYLPICPIWTWPWAGTLPSSKSGPVALHCNSHLPMPMGRNTYLWNHWMDFLRALVLAMLTRTSLLFMLDFQRTTGEDEMTFWRKN